MGFVLKQAIEIISDMCGLTSKEIMRRMAD
jgi:hypothetical protein